MRRAAIANAVSVLAGSVVILAAWILVPTKSANLCGGSAILQVWSSIEPGKYTGKRQRPGAVEAVARSIGTCVRVEGKSSGLAEKELEDLWGGAPGDAPDVWLPSDSLWVNLLNSSLPASERVRIGRSLASSRMVIAVTKDRAAALGWTPTEPPTWSDIRDAVAEQRLLLIKENARDSTSGAMSTLLAYRAGSTRPLPGVERIRSGPSPALALQIERAVAWYPAEIVDFLGKLDAAQQPRSLLHGADAIVLQGALFAQYPKLASTLEALPIRNESARTDHPYVRRPHLSGAVKTLADAFERRLAGTVGRKEFAARRFEGPVRRGSEWFRESSVVQAVLQKWTDELRRRVRLTILLDESVPLTDAERAALRAGLRTSLRRLSDTDHVALVGFPDPSDGLVDPLPRRPGAPDDPRFERPQELADTLPDALRDATATTTRRTPLLEAMVGAAEHLEKLDPDPQNPETRAVITLTARADTVASEGRRRELLEAVATSKPNVVHYVVPIRLPHPMLDELDRHAPVLGRTGDLTTALLSIVTELGAEP
ncbi:substrate-binding domain-containing protein [Cryptosporangium sp. NPDC048952]|uniref:substrate-binding domain-containing protein n=1 Tax=Cryptosporangium sp. NPDC048952 TaxID=3363961 RepID=UPI00371E429A